MEFPAAHSMDTDWFALDEDGNVALFVSGEPGAVPEKGVVWCGPGGAPEDGREAFWQTVVLGAAHAADGEPDELPEGFGIAAFRTEEAAREAVGAFACLRYGDFWWARIDESFDARCDGCVGVGGLAEEPVEAAREAGMFVYGADYGDPGIYERTDAPEVPVKLTAEQLREVGSDTDPSDVAHRFPLKFAETEEFNIGDHVLAHHWGGEIGPGALSPDERDRERDESGVARQDEPPTSRALVMLVLIALVVLALLVLRN